MPVTRTPNARVLVLDGELESTLAVVRSLGRKGIEVHVGSCAPRPISAYSRYCKRFLPYPDPVYDVAGFQAFILGCVEGNAYSLVVPVTDLTICPLMPIRREVEDRCPVAMASNRSLSLAHSKSITYELAGRCGVPVPRSITVTRLDDTDIARAALPRPVVIKPDRSRVWAAGEAGAHLRTAYGFDHQRIEAEVRRLLGYGPVVLQEHIRGDAVGLGVLASGGRVLTSFQFRSLHEVPLTGGISSLRVSEPVDPVLARYCSMLLEALEWDGVAHVEFIRRESTRAYSFMEINGRFWASLPLALAAGMDFPGHFYDLLAHERHRFPESYRTGVRCRLLYREIDWAKEVLRRLLRREADALVVLPERSSIVADILGLLNPFQRTDVMDFLDPIPDGYDRVRFLVRAVHEAARIALREKSE